MLMGISVDTSEAERAMLELYRESDRELPEILKFNAIDLTKSLVFNTPKTRGNLRAGWWPAWRALNIPGSPGTRQRFGEKQVGKGKRKRRFFATGHVIDRRNDPNEPSIEVANTSYLIMPDGRHFFYALISQPRDVSSAQKVLAATNREVTFKWHNRLEKAMRKRSAR